MPIPATTNSAIVPGSDTASTLAGRTSVAAIIEPPLVVGSKMNVPPAPTVKPVPSANTASLVTTNVPESTATAPSKPPLPDSTTVPAQAW